MCAAYRSPHLGQHSQRKPVQARLVVTHFRMEPGAAVAEPGPSSDCLIIGINGGDLVNEKPPFLHVSLEKDAVTLMPKGGHFGLRNNSSEGVEFRLLEIRR
jgi:hypothetical protein